MATAETAPSAINCNAGFLKKGNVECIAPPSTGCTAVNTSGECTACSSAGYTLNTTTKACITCASATAINDSANVARYTCTFSSGAASFTACATNHYLGSDDKCYTTDANCSYTADTDSKSTVSGDNACDKDCSAAPSGTYVYLDSTTKKCTACPTGCTACSNATTCTACNNSGGYYINTTGGTSCVIPSLKCLTYTAADKCATCKTD
jgi:hypothetical protein